MATNRARLLEGSEPADWLRALELEPTDEGVLARLLESPFAERAWVLYSRAMNDLGLPPDPHLRPASSQG